MNNKKLAIIGAGGHGRVLADIARLNNYRYIVFADDNEKLTECGGYPIVCKINDVLKFINEEYDIVVAVGNSKLRQGIQESLSNFGKVVSLIHPNSTVSSDVVIGEGTVIMAGAVINPGTKIGNGCIINTGATVDHDNVIGDYAHVSVGAHLAGTVLIGKRTWIGAGVIISNNINICDDCIIGAGAVVINDIEVSGTYVGIPARKVK